MSEEFNNSAELTDQEYNPSAGIEDLLAEEEEDFSPQPTRIKTGVGGNRRVAPERPAGFNPNADRLLFNPFETIDVRNEGAGCGFDFVENVIFHRVKTLNTKVAKTDTYNLPDTGHKAENYDDFSRTAHMIATEIVNKHGDKGVIIVSGLTGQDDETVGNLNSLLFGEEVLCSPDPNDDDHPCPVLPTLLEELANNVRKVRASDMGETEKKFVAQAAFEVRNAIQLAMRNAQARIDEAQKRLLDEKNPNRNLSHAEQRCYLALGREIPNQMPFLTKSAAANVNQGGIDFEAIGRGVAAGMQQAQGAPVVAPFTPTAVAESPSFEVTDEDVETVEEVIPTEPVKVKTGKAKNQ